MLSRVHKFGAAAILVGFTAGPAFAIGVPAGTTINNTAEVSYNVGTVTSTVSSNPVSVTVAEILDVVVTVQTPTVSVSPGAVAQLLRYRVTNTGNGPETFHLVMNNAIAGDQFDPVASSPAIYLDSNNNGTLDASDAQYTAGTNDPVLNADEFVTVFVRNDIPAAVVDTNTGRSSLAATARTGSGPAGTTFAGQGAGGTDAVVGLTTASSTETGVYRVEAISIAANKTQVVADRWGGTRPVPGATINYTIVVSATGTGTATAAQFTDNIPANTTFVPGSLRLNTTTLTDGADLDAGAYEATPTARVRVALGNISQAAGSQTIQFAVTIN